MKTINPFNRLLLVIIVMLSATFNAYAYDLFGSDITGLDVQTADQCAAACNGNNNCLAWTFVFGRV